MRIKECLYLFLGLLVSCKSSQNLKNDARNWVFRKGHVQAVASADQTSILLIVSPMKKKYHIIDYTDLSLQTQATQIAAAYGMRYVKFIKPIDTAAFGELGGGRTGNDIPLMEYLYKISIQARCFATASNDTIIVERRHIGGYAEKNTL